MDLFDNQCIQVFLLFPAPYSLLRTRVLLSLGRQGSSLSSSRILNIPVVPVDQQCRFSVVKLVYDSGLYCSSSSGISIRNCRRYLF